MTLTDSGIYQIKNLTSGKIYIGSSVKILKRWNEHFTSLKENKHSNRYLQKAYNKDQAVLEYSILVYCDIKDLLFYEQRFLTAYWDGGKTCYNICPIAGSSLGRLATEETKKKMSVSRLGNSNSKGKIKSQATIEKIRVANTGKKHSEETKKKISLALSNKIKSEEHRKHLSESKKNKRMCKIKKKPSKEKFLTRVPWNKGISRTKEEKNKISSTKGITKEIEKRVCLNWEIFNTSFKELARFHSISDITVKNILVRNRII